MHASMQVWGVCQGTSSLGTFLGCGVLKGGSSCGMHVSLADQRFYIMATQFAMLLFELKTKLRCTAFFIRTKDPEDPVKILKIKTLINDVSIHYPSFFPRLRAPGFNTVLTAAPLHAWLVRQPPRLCSLPPTVTKPLCSLCMAVSMPISFISLPF